VSEEHIASIFEVEEYARQEPAWSRQQEKPHILERINEYAGPLFIILVQSERGHCWRSSESMYKKRDNFCNGLTFKV
jgi:hypothetical protein